MKLARYSSVRDRSHIVMKIIYQQYDRLSPGTPKFSVAFIPPRFRYTFNLFQLVVGCVLKEDKALGPECFEDARPIDRARPFTAVIWPPMGMRYKHIVEILFRNCRPVKACTSIEKLSVGVLGLGDINVCSFQLGVIHTAYQTVETLQIGSL